MAVTESVLTDAERRKDAGRRVLRIALRVLAGLVGLIIVAWAILFITKGRFLKPVFERTVSHQTQRRVAVAGDFQLFFNPFNIKFRAEGLTISNPDWADRENFFESKRIDTNIATMTLIFGKRRVNWLDLSNGAIDLEWDKTGKHNTWTLGDPDVPGEPITMPLIRQASITGSTLRYRAPQMDFVTDLKIETVKARNTRFENDIRFSGTGSSRQRPFTVSGSLMSPNHTIAGGRNQLAIEAAGAGNRLSVAGTLPSATEFEGSNLKLRARGPNVASLLQFLGATTPPTRRYQFTSNLTKRGDAWRLTRLRGTFGDSDLAGAVTLSQPANRLLIDADLASRVLDIIDAGPWVGYDPQRLDRLGARGAITTEAGHPRILPDASLDVAALRHFDAHVVYQVRRVRMDHAPISNVGLTFDLDHSLLKLSPLTFEIARGHFASDIIIDARGGPVTTDYDIRLSPTPMGLLFAKFGVEQSGTNGVIKARVQLKGRGDSVRESLASSNGRIAFILPAGSFWTRNIQLAELDIGTFVQKMFEKKLKEPVRINCGLVAFTVRNGIAAADPILIDTSKNVIAGRGGFSFKTESLDLAFRADAKTFSIFSGQSPVRLGGYFAAPNIDAISPELMTRAGAALGAGLLLSPLAAVIAFVDPGDAQSAACGPVLAGSRAAAQHTVKGEAIENVGSGKSADPDSKPKKKKKFLGIF